MTDSSNPSGSDPETPDQSPTADALQGESGGSALYQFDDNGSLLATHLPLPRRSGKVRDVYELDDHLLIVSTDRISAFDHILPAGIPDKGRLLTAMSRFWFDQLETPHHFLSDQVPTSIAEKFDTKPLIGRIMVVKRANVVPFECVVRGYLEGSGWREYQATSAAGQPMVGGHILPAGMQQCDRLPEPIFTPSTKADSGHDENVTVDQMAAIAGVELTEQLSQRSLQIYAAAANFARERGILIADTKFEFGHDGDGQLILVDEVLTPDSSRFWSLDDYQPGHAQASMDKQFVREYLQATDWDKNSPPPSLPPETVRATSEKYQQAFDRLVQT